MILRGAVLLLIFFMALAGGSHAQEYPYSFNAILLVTDTRDNPDYNKQFEDLLSIKNELAQRRAVIFHDVRRDVVVTMTPFIWEGLEQPGYNLAALYQDMVTHKESFAVVVVGQD